MYKLIKNSELQRGVTLIEILMSIGVLMLFSFLFLSSLSSYQDTQVLNTETDIMLGVVLDALTKTIKAEGGSQYGVHFESEKIVLFKGVVYDIFDSDNIEHFLDGLVSISDILINGGGSDVVFKKNTGETDFYGTITLSLNKDPAQYRTITIYETGVASR